MCGVGVHPKPTTRTLEYVPINDNALSMTGGGPDESSIAVAELIARDVAALLSVRS